MLKLTAGALTFWISEDASSYGFTAEKAESGTGDFWRLILDDGQRTEIPVLSGQQKGTAALKNGKLTVVYNELLSEYGDRYDICFTVVVDVCEGMLRFTPSLSNASSVRVNECFCPLVDFNRINGDKEKDILYMPDGLGTRKHDPWHYMTKLYTNYYSHDDKEVFWHLVYPRACMSWFGVQSSGKFLYVARYDEQMRLCYLTVKQRIHSDPLNLMLGVDHFPMLLTGETIDLPSTVVGLLDGDWTAGARKYREYADRTFYRVLPRADWVRKLTGWQRIIMRSQYGEDYYKASDLPEVYRIGKKYGINTIFLFAWWKQGMDRNYPFYEEPYPGAFGELRENIRKVREMGGRVILETNEHFMDPHGEFYREHGELCRILDINGNEARPSFVYPGRGELRAQFGGYQFALACTGTEKWRNVLSDQFELMASFDPDCLFADCFGGCPYQPCFNRKHEHGNRVDAEWTSHRKVFDDLDRICDRYGMVPGTEIVTDIAASYTQFIHGLVNVTFQYGSDAYPPMFRYTFPEVITTERGIRDEEGDFRARLMSSLTYGLRLDAELYVCRADLDRSPKYAEVVKYYTGKLDEYSDFIYDGRFISVYRDDEPSRVRMGEYLSSDGTRILRILFNFANNTPAEFAGVSLAPMEIRFDVFNADEYRRQYGRI